MCIHQTNDHRARDSAVSVAAMVRLLDAASVFVEVWAETEWVVGAV